MLHMAYCVFCMVSLHFVHPPDCVAVPSKLQLCPSLFLLLQQLLTHCFIDAVTLTPQYCLALCQTELAIRINVLIVHAATMRSVKQPGAPPERLWKLVKSEVPQLCNVAVRLMAMGVNAAGCERIVSQMGLTHTRLRNRLGYAKQPAEWLFAYVRPSARQCFPVCITVQCMSLAQTCSNFTACHLTHFMI